jgi:hypothetical protein
MSPKRILEEAQSATPLLGHFTPASKNYCKRCVSSLANNCSKCENTVVLLPHFSQIFSLSNLKMTQAHEIIVITSCTSRKKKAGTVLTLENADTAGSLKVLAKKWQQQVQAASQGHLHAAAELYGGRSITEAKRAADSLSAPLHIVSAAHGLLRADDSIPSYDVTVTPAPGNPLHRCLLRLGRSPADWWPALIEAFGEQRSLAGLVARSPESLVLLAVPSIYLILLSEELADLSDDVVSRLRVLTSSHGASTLPARLQSAVMPYDDRLEGLAAYSGTRSDFPQRALRHFVTVLAGHKMPLETARQQVHEAMCALQKPVLPERQRKTDDEIIALLRQNWKRLNGSATALLRYLRDDALVSCEQSRFRSLRQHLLTEFNNKTGTHG